MTPDTPPHLTQRISLSKAQLRTELGVELLHICQSVTADGVLAAEEVSALGQWLTDSKAGDLPAATYLSEVVSKILADGKVTPEESRQLHEAIETVLPPELRRVAKDARKSVEQEAKQSLRLEHDRQKELEREEAARNRPIGSLNFMVAGCRYDDRPVVISRYAAEDTAVSIVHDLNNSHSRNALAILLPNGKQIGFVPEAEAADWAPKIDAGARVEATIVKVLTGGRSPIPIVQAYLFRADSTRGRSADNAVHRTTDEYKGSTARGILWLAILVVIVVFAVKSCG